MPRIDEPITVAAYNFPSRFAGRREHGSTSRSTAFLFGAPCVRVLFAALTAICANVTVSAQEVGGDDQRLGEVHFPISCNEEAQKKFDFAVILLHHMTYPQAKSAFTQVAELDPTCAMAQWGVAMTLFQPLWPTRPGRKELEDGWLSIQKATALNPPTERDRLFLAAAGAFFRDPESTDYWERIRRWAAASETLYRRFPDDVEAAAFYALSLLATAPAGGSSHDHQDRAAALLLAIQAEHPLHPGAFHYLIHANDVRGREHESLDLVRGYDDIAPRNPHALHMPTHIFTRLGDWKAVIDGNLKAAEAALEHPAGDHGEYVWDEFPHALEYLVYAYLQVGADSSAKAQIQRLQATHPLHPTFKTAFHVSSIPARFALERQAWKEAADLAPRPLDGLDWDRFPWPEAVTWFARGLGAAHLNRIDDALQASDRLRALETATSKAGDELFARQIRVLRLGVAAWTAQAQGRTAMALDSMTAAAALELATPKHPVTPAPTLPADEQLGQLLLEQGRPDSALTAFERSLTLYPKRFNSLLGAARAARAGENARKAGRFYAELVEVSDPDSPRAGLAEARAYLADGDGGIDPVNSCAETDSLTVRNAHAMTYDDDLASVVLFGGADEREVFADLWAWDGEGWTCLSDDGPSPRTFPALAYDGASQRLVLFGGNRVLFGTPQDTATFLDDMWAWDGRTWNQIHAPTPTARAEASVAYDSDRRRLVLFGGYRNEGDQRIRLGDTWEWDGLQWEQVNGDGPAPRNGAAMAYDADRRRIVLFGGSGNAGDTWEWDGTEWHRITSAETSPRFNPAAAYDSAMHTLIRFGGWTGDGRLGDTWKYDGVEWTKIADTGPAGRNHAAMAYDATRDVIVLFGGHDGDRIFGDTWVWNGHTWSQTQQRTPRLRMGNGH